MACDSKILDGSMLRIYIDGVMVAHDTSCELSISHSTRETTTKINGGWKSFIQGMKDWSVSGDALYASDTERATTTNKLPGDIFNYLVNGGTVLVKLMTPSVTDGYYQGYAIFDSMSVNSGNSGENVTYSFSLQGDGELVFLTA